MQDTSKIFQKTIKLKVGDGLSAYIYKALSNMLALDFSLRQLQISLDEYALRCANNISNYLGERKMLSQDFNHVLEIFTIAIAQPADSNNDILDKNQAVKLDENIIEQIFNNCSELKSLNEEERDIIRDLLGNLQKRDPQINFDILLKDTKILSKSLHDVNAKTCQEQVMNNILAFLNIQKYQQKSLKSVAQGRLLAR